VLSLIAACLIALPGPVVEPFAPIEPYGGHWGVDVTVAPGSLVSAPLDGVVSFAGEVAGVRTVTIRSGIQRVSVSYLESVTARRGQSLAKGDHVGRAGVHGGRSAVHISVRLLDRYVDPVMHARCRPGGTLRLLPPMLAELVSKD
jgi:septal ring factor EnvC (AmiA/AmiB activator)